MSIQAASEELGGGSPSSANTVRARYAYARNLSARILPRIAKGVQAGADIAELVLGNDDAGLREHGLAVFGGHDVDALLADVREPEVVGHVRVVLHHQRELLALVPLAHIQTTSTIIARKISATRTTQE